MDTPKIKRALISVSDKTGIVDFARQLLECGVEILSTGGTMRHLVAEGIGVTDVAEYTDFPEMMDGRVKTLHPKIFAGVLCRHDVESDLSAMADHDILPFELVVVNLYPFVETIAKPGVSRAEAIEKIDIGGPSLIRAAAKNSDYVTVVCEPEQYDQIMEEIKNTGRTTIETRKLLMAAAFQHTARYDVAIADYFCRQESKERFPGQINLTLNKQTDLRYGENSHLDAAVYTLANPENENNLLSAKQTNGRRLSYNNLLDLDSALEMVRGLELPACSVVKHNNPCGAAWDSVLLNACQKSMSGDPVSAFGSVLGFNRTVDADTADFLASGDHFIEAIVAPSFDEQAHEILTTKPKWKKNVRLLSAGELKKSTPRFEYRNLIGGMLVQDADNGVSDHSTWNVVTEKPVDDSLLNELAFGWHMVRYVKSNAIVLSKDCALVGVGAGQMSRVDSVEISIRKAGDRAAGSFLASDAFFPFPDSIEIAAKAGIRAIVQPGCSVKDDEVIAACNKHGIPMVLTGRRHFRH